MAVVLKNALKEHYRKKELSSFQLEKLDSLQKKPKTINMRSFIISTLAVVASLLLAFFNLYQATPQFPLEEIMQEVAYNHNKKVAPEVHGNSIRQIQDYLDRLDFTLIQPTRLAAEFKLLGARYCSIQGKLAAQFKLQKISSDQTYTLYQLPVQRKWNKKELITQVQAINGTVVSIWIEKGLLLALAGPAQAK